MYPNQPPNGQHGFQPYPMDWNAPPPKRGFQWMPDTTAGRWRYAGVALVLNVIASMVATGTDTPAAFAVSAPCGIAVWVYGIAAVVAWRKEKAASAPNYDYGFGVPPAPGAGGYQPYPQQPVYNDPHQMPHPVAPQQPAPSADPVADIMSRLQGLSEEDAHRLNRLIDGDNSGS